MTLLHIPANVWYENITGRKVDSNTLIRMILDGEMDISRHYTDSANIENDFYSVDTDRGVRTPIELYDVVNANNPKTMYSTDTPDIRTTRNLDAGKWQRGVEGDPVIDIRDDMFNSNFYSVLLNSQERKVPTTGYSLQTRILRDLALANDRNKGNLERYAYLKGVDKVNVNRLNYQLANNNDFMYYKATVNSSEVPVKDALKTINSNRTGYAIRQDLKDFLSDSSLSKEEVRALKDNYKNLEQDNLKAVQYNEDKKKLYEQATAMLRTPKSEYDNLELKATWDVSDNEVYWKENHWTRSGIDDKGVDQLAVDIGIKNYKAGSAMTKDAYMQSLNKLKSYVGRIGMDEFEKICKYNCIKSSEELDNPEFTEHLKSTLGIKTIEDENDLAKDYDSVAANYPEVIDAYNKHIQNIMDLSERAALVTNEPFTRNYIYMMPFMSSNKEARESQIYSTIKNMASISKYDIMSRNNILKQNLVFNFFEGSERIIKDLSDTLNSQSMADALLGKYTDKALIDNKPILDEAFKIIDETEAIADLKPFTSFNSEITQKVLDIVSLYTDINIKDLRRYSKNPSDLLKNAFRKVRYDVDSISATLPGSDGFDEETGEVIETHKPTLTEAYRYARGDLSNTIDIVTKDTYEKLYNNMYAEILIAQRIIEADKYAASKLNSYITSLYDSGKVLVNKFGQKIERNGIVAPTDKASFGYLKENLELTFNSRSPEMFSQYVLEKALSGELFVMDSGLADMLEQKVYTAKVPGRVKQALTKASKFAAGIQMALPAKIAGRLMRFTGTDYNMGIVSNPKVAQNIPRASREIYAAVMSKGNNISSDLQEYLSKEGQGALYGTGVDPLDPSINGITNKLTSPFEIQNHLGRYAIWLTAKESFEEGKPWYGSQYYNHEAIDAIKDPGDKAMYVMDYLLGSPGGFPELSKHTSGYLMYATFPMNFARTLGSYGMSLGKLFQEGVTAENKTQWYNNVVTPSLGMAGIGILSNLILTAICDMFGIDEETEKKWKEEGVTLDPIGTLIGGTPSVVYDSINPAFLAKEMFINPFTNEYNNTLPKKGYGWIKANLLSKLNPANVY